MLDAFHWSGLKDAAWPLLAGLAVLAMIRRQQPAEPVARICGAFLAVLLYAAVTSPRDPSTGKVLPSDTLSLLVAMTAGLGFLLVAFRWE